MTNKKNNLEDRVLQLLVDIQKNSAKTVFSKSYEISGLKKHKINSRISKNVNNHKLFISEG
jgi:hypothetical protein